MLATVQARLVTCGRRETASNQCHRRQGSHGSETWRVAVVARELGACSYKELCTRATIAPWHLPIGASRKQERHTTCVLNVSAEALDCCMFRMLCDVVVTLACRDK